jgi:hypothetical protein
LNKHISEQGEEKEEMKPQKDRKRTEGARGVID